MSSGLLFQFPSNFGGIFAVDDKSVPFFGSVTTFEKSFPSIEDLSISIELSNGPWPLPGEDRTDSYTKETLRGDVIACRNPSCRRGGFNIGAILHEMVSKKETELSTGQRCFGDEGSPKGRVKGRRCAYQFKAKISITYKQSELPPERLKA